MVNHKKFKAIVLATTCLTPLAAFAQSMGSAVGEAPFNYNSGNEAEFGLMGVVGKNSDQAGRYNGLTTTGIDIIGQFDFSRSSPWDSGGTWFYNLTGENLVFQTGTGLGSGCSVNCGSNYTSSTFNSLANNGSLNFVFGNQGSWQSSVYYDAITYTGNVIDSIYSVTGNHGQLNGSLSPWGGATFGAAGPISSYTVPSLTATGAMQPVQTGTRRDIFGSNFKYIDGDWTFSGALRHEHKGGSLEESLDLKYAGVAFALPIDYDTDRYDLAAAYNTRLYQTILQYTFSHFHDNNLFTTLPQLTSMTVVPYQESAAYSTPPSNSAHYITLMTATNAVPNTRINLNFRGGLEMQGDIFPPDSADPNAAGAGGFGNLNSYGQGTSNTSLNAIARIFQGKVSADSHPITNADARVYYGFDGRNVSLNQYKVFTGSGGGSGDASFTGTAFVVPQNWLKQNAGVEVGYRIIPQYDTKLTAGYRFDVVDRSNAQVTNSRTNTETVTLSSTIGPQVNSSLSYTHADRNANLTYLGPWNNFYGNTTSAGGTTGFYTGAFYQAPMTSDAVKLRADYAPMVNLSGGLFVQFKNENYHYPADTPEDNSTISQVPITGVGAGIKQDYNLTVGPDVNYRPSEDVNLHFFYTFERIFYNNIGIGACADATQAATAVCAGTAGYFQNKYTSDVHTVGTSGEWKVTDKLKLGAEYTIAYGSVMFGEYNGVFVTTPTAGNFYQNVTNFPNVISLMNNLKLTATYAVAPTMDLLLQGTWSYFHNNDWNNTANAIQGASATTPTPISYMTPGYGSPNYSIATVMTGIKYKF
jgi:hypothetical protein